MSAVCTLKCAWILFPLVIDDAYLQVYSSSLVDVERDYLSIDKRYPRLFVSPEFSKAVVNWPKENLKLPIHSPVSFEHDFIEEERLTELKGSSAELLAEETTKSGNTVWSAKVINFLFKIIKLYKQCSDGVNKFFHGVEVIFFFQQVKILLMRTRHSPSTWDIYKSSN
ncbi:protein SHORT ROOT IN SALT MEDIUM 1-like [Juglans regia]|uniref:Protein SHORT ROOT IN SALT MEDIUM 1-like n=1 Tax=Juglans regia TaxID=51240 RepID=A0A6P9DYM0_JUGRE|nr:protein SHORT ROOT IN SALT MEDIUM 1-like [Juglans regia]